MSMKFVDLHCDTIGEIERSEGKETLKNNTGHVSINFCAAFLTKDSNYTSIDAILSHARHIRDKAGIDAVAFGSDFDGIESELEFKDYSGMPLIADALGRGFCSAEVEKICSGNALRVIRESMK